MIKFSCTTVKEIDKSKIPFWFGNMSTTQTQRMTNGQLFEQLINAINSPFATITTYIVCFNTDVIHSSLITNFSYLRDLPSA